MKTCSFENQINAYLDGELSGAKLRSFEAHLQQCPECRKEVEQYRAMLDSLKGLEEREVPSQLQERLHTALIKEIEKGDGRVKRKFNPWALTAAAAVVVCLVAGALLVNSGLMSNTLKATPSDDFNAARNYAGDSGLGGTGSAESAGNPTVEAPSRAQGIMPAPVPTAAPSATMAAAAADGATKNIDTQFSEAIHDASGNGMNALAKQEEGRKIIYMANLVVETREYDKCLDTVKSVMEKYGGYRESSQEYGVPDADTTNAGRTAVIAIRMPIGKYDTAMADLQALGNVLSMNESTEDVSRQYVDTEARNKTLKMQRDQLYALLAKADSMENIIALQNEISRLTVEIEQMTAQLNYWDDKVSYSTITVELRELVTPKTVKPVDPDLNSRMNGALNVTLNNMKKGLENFTVGFVGFLPWLAVIAAAGAVVAAVAIPVARRARRAAARKDRTEPKKEE